MKNTFESILMIILVLVLILAIGLACVKSVVEMENSKLCKYLGYDTAAMYIPDDFRIDCVKTIRMPLDDLK